MMNLDKAIQRIIDRITADGNDESTDIYKYMYQYKAIRELPTQRFEETYDEIAEACGF